MKGIIYKIKNEYLLFLAQPYPFYYRGKTLAIIASLLFVLAILFLYIFEPFIVYTPEHKINYFWISFIHACTPVAIIVLWSLFKTTSETEENWNVRKEILLLAFFLLLTGVAQFLIRDIIYNNPNNWSWRYFIEEIRNTFLIGILFAIILISLNFNRLNNKNRNTANALDLSHNLIKSTPSNSIVFIETQTKSDDFELNLDNFVFAKADGNYVQIYTNKEGINKLLKRITLKELESVLKPFSNIIKTHRSYLVNLNHLNSVTGNAQGYELKLDNCNKKIPVSRTMIKFFDSKMNAF